MTGMTRRRALGSDRADWRERFSGSRHPGRDAEPLRHPSRSTTRRDEAAQAGPRGSPT